MDKKISNNVIRRLPRYMRYIDEMVSNGVVKVSSADIAEKTGLNASQVRQDLSHFGQPRPRAYKKF